MTLTGKGRRLKGAAYEREIAQELSDWLGVDCRRKLGAARDGGDDIQVGDFRIECKRQETIHPYPFLRQAVSNAKAGEIPMVVARKSHEDSIVILRWKDMLRIIRDTL